MLRDMEVLRRCNGATNAALESAAQQPLKVLVGSSSRLRHLLEVSLVVTALRVSDNGVTNRPMLSMLSGNTPLMAMTTTSMHK